MIKKAFAWVGRGASRVWGLVGWAADHVSRVLFVIGLVGVLIAGGAIVVALAQHVSLLTLYLVVIFVPLGLLTMGVWSTVGVRAWSAQGASSDAAKAPVATQPDPPQVFASLHFVPLHDETNATLRVENLGSEAHIAIRMLRIGTNKGSGMPY